MNAFETSCVCDEFVAQIQAQVPALGRTDAPSARASEKTRPLTVEELCAFYRNESDHTEHVARLALQLFDATHRWVGLPREDRRLLKAASQLHDVAYQVDPVHHVERSAEIVWRKSLDGFSTNECAKIAAIILFHGGKWKNRLKHPMLKSVPDMPRVMQLGALLRIADGLDWGHVQDATIIGARKFHKLVRVRVGSAWFEGNLSRADHKADLWREVFPSDIRFVRARAIRPRPMVESSTHTLEAARRLMSVQYKTILTDVEGAVAGDDPEHLHRIRIAIRRLRCLLRVFRRHLPESTSVDDTLASLGDTLGSARDLDVWMSYLRSDDITSVVKENRRWRAFVQYHEQVRRLQLHTVRRELRGSRFNTMRRQMAKLLRTQLPVLIAAKSPAILEKFAAKKFLKELRRLRSLSELRRARSPEKLHQLRVALRRARYLGEFFGPVLGQGARKLTRRLHQVERPLARIHDLDTGWLLVQQGGPAAPRVFAQLLQTHREHQQNLVKQSWHQLVALEKKTRRGLQSKPRRTKRSQPK